MSLTQENTLLSLFPLTAQVRDNRLLLGGCDTVELAREFGTPLYIFDEVTLRHRCAAFQEEFGGRYPPTLVIYAAKAFLGRALAALLREEGLGLDVVSGGEMAIARSVGFPPEKVYFHGNNKSEAELQQALEWGVGRIVVDNFYELSLLAGLAGERKARQDILLRLSPGIDPQTHRLTATGVVDSKFGFLLAQAEAALEQALRAPSLRLVGLHFHLGSPIFEVEPYREAMALVLGFAAEMEKRHGFQLREFSPGGGFAITYVREKPAPPLSYYAQAITSTLREEAKKWGVEPPRLIVEPGRSIVGPAAVALYRVGASKEIPGLSKYISVDGGMADNIRPPLYGAKYEALVANRAAEPPAERVNIAGKFCESGDVLLREAELPRLAPGDLLAIPCMGAYSMPLASNYNASLRPAIVMVKEGQARLVRRRESFEDLLAKDIV